MLILTSVLRRVRGDVAFDGRTGAVCTAACRAAARRDRDLEQALRLRGPR